MCGEYQLSESVCEDCFYWILVCKFKTLLVLKYIQRIVRALLNYTVGNRLLPHESRTVIVLRTGGMFFIQINSTRAQKMINSDCLL